MVMVLAQLVLSALDNSKTHNLLHVWLGFACWLLVSFPWERLDKIQFQLFQKIQTWEGAIDV
jgi:hypothetical protein